MEKEQAERLNRKRYEPSRGPGDEYYPTRQRGLTDADRLELAREAQETIWGSTDG